jgi:uncharacterized small protein (DUF1192 family)
MRQIQRWKPRSIELTDHQREVAGLEAEIERLQAGYQATGFEGWPCPGCRYENGVFISNCALHAEIERLKANRDYWMSTCQEAQTHRDAANLKLGLADAEIERLRSLLAYAAPSVDHSCIAGDPDCKRCEIEKLLEDKQ